MAAMLVVGLVLGWYVEHVRRQQLFARLRELGAGVCDDLKEDDFALVEMALNGSTAEERRWACLALEKFAQALIHAEGDSESADTGRVARLCLTPAYVARRFPRLLGAADAADPDLNEFAFRAMGSLARHTDVLSRDQIATSCDKAVASLESDDFERRRRGVHLLSDLMGRLDDTRQKKAVDQLLQIAADWLRSDRWTWGEWQHKVNAPGTPRQRFQHQALQALLYNCRFINDDGQAMRAYRFLETGLAGHALDLQAVVSMAALASRLPAAQRRNVAQLVIGGVSDRLFWHDVGSGVSIWRNYAADALLQLAACLDKDEVQQALKAIKSQHLDAEHADAFKAAKMALQSRLAQSN
ncbi:MAG TPA: hypothetical protein VNH11_10795 [Pirellulales bacterium]|nr:hypothetical protein [Pirellulales bacterium]